MNEESLFHEALQKPPQERAGFLDQACADDRILRQHVEMLLRAHENPGSFLAKPPLAEAVTVPPAEHPADRPLPSLPDDYEIVRELGRGGMGVVYLAKQKSLGRDVAVKVLRPGEATFGPLVKRFLEEARHLARLRHPNIVSIHEIGHAESEPYFTMDYVEGEPLSAILARSSRLAAATGSARDKETASISDTGPGDGSPRASSHVRLSPTQALAILKQAAAGVRHAHKHGIIHRDLKPGNILVDASGHAYVTDFGLARDMAQSSKLTRSGEIMGTPAYMAPEQARGQKELIGEATDVHALGVILYEMLTGQLPYGGGAPADVIVRLITDEPMPPRKLDRRIPRDLETICLKAMAKAPERRYASVTAFLEDIRRFEAGEPVLARRPGHILRAARFVRRQWKLGAAIVVTAALVMLATLAGMHFVAPQLFDRSVPELLRWAQEQQAADHKEDALRIYAHAYRKAPSMDREGILASMLLCAVGLDPLKVGEAVQEVIEVDPGVSFQNYDYAVMRAWGTPRRWEQLRQANPQERRRGFETAEKRLLLVIGGNYASEAEKKEANEHLTRLRDMLAALEVAPNVALELPIGEQTVKLLKQAAKPGEDPWKAGKAAFAAGVQFEKSGDKAQALTAYKQAYDLLRRACPIYSRLGHSVVTGLSRNDQPEANETRLLREVFSAVKRLDPNARDTMRGGIRFRIVGEQIPKSVAVFLQASLWEDPKPKLGSFGGTFTPDGELVSLMPGTFPIQMDGTAWIGVADGKYRLRVFSTGSGAGGAISAGAPQEDNEISLSRLAFDFADVTKDVIDIHGQTVEIPIRSRVLKEVAREAPAEGEKVDLATVVFRWREVPGATSYRIGFGYSEQVPGGVRGEEIWSTNVPGTNYTLANLPPPDNKKLARLKLGVEGYWWVSAFDANRRQIATSGHWRFVVEQGLTKK